MIVEKPSKRFAETVDFSGNQHLAGRARHIQTERTPVERLMVKHA